MEKMDREDAKSAMNAKERVKIVFTEMNSRSVAENSKDAE
jgi:hypothetical protein